VQISAVLDRLSDESVGINHIQDNGPGIKTAFMNGGEVCMIRSLLKVVLVVIVLVGLAAFLIGRWSSNVKVLPDSSVSASGPVDTSKARDVGAKVGETTAKAANEAEDAIAHAAVTAKIKSKMALDDLVKARNIDVDTNGTVVTLTGVVDSEAERKRAVALAKETEGVTLVIDHLRMR
jgi:BON domain-containing protein